MSRALWFAAGLILSASTTAPAGIVNLGTANAYNVFVLGNDTQTNASSEGRVAVGGDATFGSGFNGYSIGTGLAGSKTTNLVVGGNYTNNFTTVNGSVVIGGNATLFNPTIQGNLNVNGDVGLTWYGSINGALTYGGSLSNPNTSVTGGASRGTTSLPVDFASEQTYLTKLSSDLSRALGYTYGNGVAFTYSTFALTGTSSNLNVFSIKGSDLASATSLTINAPAGATVVINVDGKVDQMKNFGFTLNGVDKQNVLFNFHQATSLTFSGVGIQGSVLAPFAAIGFNSGTIDGTLIGASLSGNGSARDFQFRGDLSSAVIPSAVPEPATILSTVTGLAMAGIAASRRRRSA